MTIDDLELDDKVLGVAYVHLANLGNTLKDTAEMTGWHQSTIRIHLAKFFRTCHLQFFKNIPDFPDHLIGKEYLPDKTRNPEWIEASELRKWLYKEAKAKREAWLSDDEDNDEVRRQAYLGLFPHNYNPKLRNVIDGEKESLKRARETESFRHLAAIVLPAVVPEFFAAGNCSGFTSKGILVACHRSGISIATDTPESLTSTQARALAACLLEAAEENDRHQGATT